MLGRRTGIIRLAFAILPIITGIFLAYLFLSDFTEFNMPYRVVKPFYYYTAILLTGTVLAVLALKHYDNRLPLKKSSLWNYIRVVLGALWLLDGVLQIQPEMSFGFAPFVLIPALKALPSVLQPLAQPIIFAWASNQSIMDALSAVFQVFLGLGFLTLRSRRGVSAIAFLSFAWAIAIWIFGESFGSPGIGMSILTGFPGAALLYAIASSLLVFDFSQKTEVRILQYSLASVFLISAILQAVPANGYWNSGSIASVTGPWAFIFEPKALSYMLYNVAVTLSNNMVPWNLLLTLSLLATGLSWLFKPKAAAIASTAFSALIWVIGQDFGVLGGYGTDPNTGLVLVLLSTALYFTYREKSVKDSNLPENYGVPLGE